jgi:hypothetical protein
VPVCSAREPLCTTINSPAGTRTNPISNGIAPFCFIAILVTRLTVNYAHLKRFLIGSTYRWPCLDMTYIDMPHIDMPRFRVPLHCILSICHVSICHVLGSTCHCHISMPDIDMQRIHGYVTRITIRDGTTTPRFPFPYHLHHNR